MIIYLIRHAHAVDRGEWSASDMQRPLTAKGVKRADTAFQKYFSKYSHPEIIISSEAVRSIETAEVLSAICGCAIEKSDLINPGADIDDYESLIHTYDKKNAIAVIGHEPDMSEYISYYLSDGGTPVLMKKGSICHLDEGCLINHTQQKVLL